MYKQCGEEELFPAVAIYAGGALFLAAVGGVVFPSCSRGWAADGAVPAVVTAEIAAAAAAAAAAMRVTVATLPRVAGAAAQGASAADVLADQPTCSSFPCATYDPPLLRLLSREQRYLVFSTLC